MHNVEILLHTQNGTHLFEHVKVPLTKKHQSRFAPIYLVQEAVQFVTGKSDIRT